MRYFAAILFLLATVVSCKSKKETVAPPPPPEPPPSWVTARPISGLYYIGIGVSSKRSNSLDFAQVAKRNALGDLTSEISSTVSSQSLLYQLDQGDRFREDYQSSTMLTSKEEVEGYETVGAWENDSEYWIYYRLSKADYAEAKKQKIDLATRKGLDFFSKAKEMEVNNNYAGALSNYFQALEATKQYFAEPMEVDYEGASVFLGNELIGSISGLLGGMKLDPVRKEIPVTLGDALNKNQIGFTLTTAKGSPISGIPIRYKMGTNRLFAKQVGFTDENGIVYYNMGKVRSVESPQEICSYFNLEGVVNKSNALDPMVAGMINNFETPVGRAYLLVEKPRVFIVTNESTLGTESNTQILFNAVKKAATDKGFAVTGNRDDADFLVDVTADTRSGGVSHDMHSSFLTGTLMILNRKTGEQLYHDNLTDVKGIQLDYNKASDKAYQKASGIIQDKIFPQFYRQFIN